MNNLDVAIKLTNEALNEIFTREGKQHFFGFTDEEMKHLERFEEEGK